MPHQISKPNTKSRTTIKMPLSWFSNSMSLPCIGVRVGGRVLHPTDWKISGQTLFSGQAQVPQKSWMIKKHIFNAMKIFRATLFFGKAQLAQKSWMQRVYSIQWKISGQTLFFRASASCSKILNGEKISNTVYWVYIHMGVIRVIWTSVVCNLDQSRDWF